MKWILSVLMGLVMGVDAGGVSEGDIAPDFSGTKEDGYPIALEDYAGKWLALYFYPKSDTPGCTKQACSLRDGMADLKSLNLHVVGVSVNSVIDQAKFHAKYNLNFPLLADEDGAATKAYGVQRDDGKLARRVTFLINPEGKVASVITEVDVESHAEQIKTQFETLKDS